MYNCRAISISTTTDVSSYLYTLIKQQTVQLMLCLITTQLFMIQFCINTAFITFRQATYKHSIQWFY